MLRSVDKIGICGQMHGVVYWKDNQGWTHNLKNELQVLSVNKAQGMTIWRYVFLIQGYLSLSYVCKILCITIKNIKEN